DMLTIDVPPLDAADAQQLAERLLAGINAKSSNIAFAAAAIASAVDRVPYYIHHVANRIAFRGEEATPDVVATIVKESLTDAQDPWDLRHYRERLDTYYLADEVTGV